MKSASTRHFTGVTTERPRWFSHAAKVAANPKLTVAERAARLDALVRGKPAEARTAVKIAKGLMLAAQRANATPPWVLGSCLAHRLRFEGSDVQGQPVLLTLASQSDLVAFADEGRRGLRWLEGQLVYQGQVFSFLSPAGDALRTDLDAEGRVVRLHLDAEMDHHRLEQAADLRFAYQGPARVSLQLGCTPGAGPRGFRAPGQLQVLGLEEGHVSIHENGRFHSSGLQPTRPQLRGARGVTLPPTDRALRLDTARLWNEALKHEAPLIRNLLPHAFREGRGAAVTAQEIDAYVRTRARLDARLRIQVAPVLTRHLARLQLVELGLSPKPGIPPLLTEGVAGGVVASWFGRQRVLRTRRSSFIAGPVQPREGESECVAVLSSRELPCVRLESGGEQTLRTRCELWFQPLTGCFVLRERTQSQPTTSWP
jgi:hypothetical protein